MRARAVTGLVLLVLAPLLAACGGDEADLKVGDIVQARLDDQFKNGRESEVALPTGRLLIHSGEPVEEASGEETRTREVVAAPSGTVLVPITWQYDPWSSSKLDTIFATEDSPTVDLVSGDEHYRITPPQTAADGAQSFYVVVDGDGSDRSLELDFDGVEQTVNLRTGDRDEGAASGLYDITDDKLDKKQCDKGKWFDRTTVIAEFSCELHGPVVTPYAGGRWAPSGKTWLALRVTTSIRSYDQSPEAGSGARYLAGGVKGTATIDGEKPAFVLTTDDIADTCPIPSQQTCGWSKQLIFAVPDDAPRQGPLELEMTYKLTLAFAYGVKYDPPKHQTVSASQKIAIFK